MSALVGRRGLVLVLILALGGLVACGGTAAGADHACDLLTESDAGDLLGVPANGGYEDTDRSSGSYCEWRSKDSDDGHDASDVEDSDLDPYFISVSYERGTEAAQDFEPDQSGLDDEGDEPEPVDGLGDAAYFRNDRLLVRRGDQVFSTYVGPNDDHPLSSAERRAIERRAADIILDRLVDAADDPGLDEALDCGRTRRCSGTRFRACDLLEDAEIEEATEWRVDRVDGTAVPVSWSDDAGVCTFYLRVRNPEPGSFPERRRVEIRVEPRANEAKAAYQEALERQRNDPDTHPVPELGDDAFSSPVEESVMVLDGGAYLEVGYAADLEPDDAAGMLAAEQVTIELAGLALDRLRTR